MAIYFGIRDSFVIFDIHAHTCMCLYKKIIFSCTIKSNILPLMIRDPTSGDVDMKHPSVKTEMLLSEGDEYNDDGDMMMMH